MVNGKFLRQTTNRLRAGFGSAVGQTAGGLLAAKFFVSGAVPRIFVAQDGGGQQRGVDRARLADGQRPDGNSGICTMDNNESIPCNDLDSIGTPKTGRQVFAALTPARCAAPPAAAMMTSNPRAAAPEAYSKSRSGVRCAEMIWAS